VLLARTTATAVTMGEPETVVAQETVAESAGEEIKRCWRELRTLVRQIYAKIKADNSSEDGFNNFSISFEKTYPFP